MENKKCCGTCKYHWYDSLDKEWSCDNDEAEAYGCQTAYDDVCEEYEGRE